VLTSRRGADAIEGWDALSRMKLAYAQSLPGMHLHLCKCDATSIAETRALIESLEAPLTGVILLTLVLSDALFLSQDAQSFQRVRDSKVTVYEALSHATDVGSLDFIVHFSSISGLLGFVGQANYAR
jgi:hypothetical protein